MRKRIMVLAIFLVGLLAISAVSAASDTVSTDINNSLILQESNDENLILESELEETQSMGSAQKSFTDLHNLINVEYAANDTIFLNDDYAYCDDDGEFKEGVVIDRALTICGNGNTIDGSHSARIFNVTNSGVVFDNITFINANAAGNGGAICFVNNGTVTNCNFIGNNATSNGGGVFFFKEGNVTNCNFINNSAKNGGAIYFNGDINNVTVLGCFNGNAAERAGGAIYVKGKSVNNNFSSQFYGNNARQASGGAIFFYSLAENNIFESIFMNNYAIYGGGIFFYKNANDNNFDSNFTSNIAKSCGGAIFFYNTTNNNNFTGYFTANSALGQVDPTVGNGGAITFKDVSTNCIFTGEFINNTAALNGGGVNYRQTPHNITLNCNFINNNAPSGGGVNFFESFENVIFNGEFINNSAVNGGAIAAGSGSIKEVSFKNNHAENGGAVYFSSSGSVINCNFMNNSAKNGGAIYFNGDITNVTVLGCFKGNNAERAGGAIYVKGKAMNNNFSSQFYGNNARQASGGAIFFYSLAENNIFESIFMNNYAIYGGGIFFYKNANDNNFDSNFTSNIAKSCGGAIFFYNTTNNNNFTGYFTANSALGQVDPTVGNGGAITFKDVSTNCIFTGEFINNTAALNGGGVNYRQNPHNITLNCNFINNNAPRGGGVNFFERFENVIFNGEFINNSAINGGAIAAGAGSIKEVSFKNNRAENGGAVYFSSSSSTVENCNFTNNKASYGGAVYCNGSDCSIVGCNFTDNGADYGGAIIVTELGSNSVVSQSSFMNCAAEYYGGGIYFAAENCSLIDSTFEGNVAQNGSDWYSEHPLNVAEDKTSTVISAPDVNVTYSESANLVATLNDADGNPLAGEQIYIALNNVEYALKTDSRGEASLAIPTSLVPDTYIATISYKGNGKYDPSDNVAVVSVNKMNTRISAYDVRYTYGDVGVLTATLTDVNGNPICDSDVVIVLNKVKYRRTTDSNGQVNLSISGLSVNSYAAHIIYYGDGNYNPCDVTVSVLVRSLDSVIYAPSAVSVNYGDVAVLVVTLKDVKGNPIADSSVSIRLDNVLYYLITDSKGQITFYAADLLYGTYPVFIEYAGIRTNYSTSWAESRISVKANIDISTSYDADARELVATLTNSVTEKAIDGASVQINLNGVASSLKTDSKGQVKISTAGLSSDNYTVIISFRGKSMYNPTSITVKGSVKADMVISADYDSANDVIVATLRNSNDGNAVANVSVKVSLNYVDYALTTDSKGQVKVSTSNLPVGTFTATFYAVNSKYNSVSTRLTFSTKSGVIISAFYDEDNCEIVATLTNDEGKPLSNANIKVVIVGVMNSVTKFFKTNSKGQVKVSTVTEVYKEKTATVSYAGNSRYKPASVTVSIDIKTKVIITDVYGYSDKLVATLTNSVTGKPVVNAYMQVEINGVTKTVKSDSKGQISIDTSDLGLTSYDVKISYRGNSKYTPSSTTTAIDLNKANMNIKYSYNKYTKELVATLKNSKTGKVVSNAKMVVDINGVKTTLKSNNKGQIRFSTAGFAQETHVGTITYGGNDRYNSISAAFKMDI